MILTLQKYDILLNQTIGMATKKKAFWLSYDLGLKGDYAGLYNWLDTIKAKECGNGMAFFRRECTGNPIEVFKKEISTYVQISATDRIYLVFIEFEGEPPKLEDLKVKGNFIFGKRKRPAWEGYSNDSNQETEDSAEFFQ